MILACASSIDKNQCAFRRSLRSRLLKLSKRALSVGLPGRLKSNSARRSWADLSITLEMNSLPLSLLLASGQPALGADRVQRIDHVFSFEALPDIDGQALARVAVDHGEHAQLAAVEQRISDKVHAPDFVDRERDLLGLRSLAALFLLGRFRRSDSPSARYSWYTRLTLSAWPSRRNITCIQR